MGSVARGTAVRVGRYAVADGVVANFTGGSGSSSARGAMRSGGSSILRSI
ncbi:hypothetical protein [Nocardia sp. NPDC049707]